MKKFSLFIIVLILVVFFAGMDYLVNTPQTIDENILSQLSPKNTLKQITKEPSSEQEKDVNIVQAMLSTEKQYPYSVQRRDRTNQLFETFDLRSLTNIRIYRNVLAPEVPSVENEPSSALSPITIYEIQGVKNQGKLTYLNVKLKLMAQIGATGSINEANELAENNLYYNEDNAQNTAFLLVQIQDNLFGFQYHKQDTKTFGTIRDMIATLQTLK